MLFARGKRNLERRESEFMCQIQVLFFISVCRPDPMTPYVT